MRLLNIVIKIVKSSKFYGPILVIIGAVFIYKLINKLFDKASIRGKNEFEKKKRKTIISLFKNIIKYLIFIIACLIILNIYGVNTTSVLAGLGIAGVVIGLALQDALKDIIGGINIIMDNYYVVGDLVKINDFTGYVTHFGLKSTKIKSFAGEVLVIANRNIDKVINLSQQNAELYIRIPTAYECDHKKVEKVLNGVIDIIKEYDYVVDSKCYYAGIDELDSSSVNYMIVINCDNTKRYSLRREILTLVKDAYEKNDLKIPYNQLEVHNGYKI